MNTRLRKQSQTKLPGISPTLRTALEEDTALLHLGQRIRLHTEAFDRHVVNLLTVHVPNFVCLLVYAAVLGDKEYVHTA